MKKKKYIIIAIILIGILAIIGVSYAVWQLTLTQKTTNVVNSTCFKIEFTDENPISLDKAYPLKDEEGKDLIPYTFTITNTCSTTAFYQINLEEIETNLKKLGNQYIKVSLNNSKGKILNTYQEVEPTISDAYSSYKLTSGSIKEGELKTYELRLWLDYDVPPIEEVMNATVESKITIIAIHKEDLENDFKEENLSLSENYSNTEEIIEFKVVSRDYDIIESSENNILYEPLESPSKVISIQKTYKVDGTYMMYFKDEVGNIIESVVSTNKLDQVSPIVSFTASESQDKIKVDASKSTDEKSGIKSYYYKLNDREYIESTSSNYEFTGVSDGKYKVTVKVEDQAGNMSEEKEINVTVAYEKVYVSSKGSDATGVGSIESPYATLQSAYNKVKSGGEIVLLSDLTVIETANFNIENKEVTLRSNGTNKYSMNKSSSLTTQILYVTNSNNLTTTNVTFDGKNTNTKGSLIESYNSIITLNNTTLQNNINIGRYYDELGVNASGGGGILVSDGTLIINDGTLIQNNQVKHSEIVWGGGVTVWNSTLELNGGTITNNITQDAPQNGNRGGGISVLGSIFQFTSGTISYNESKEGGGVFLGDGSLISIINMSEGSINNNKVTSGTGGGIYITGNSELNMMGGNINNNRSTNTGGGIGIFNGKFNFQDGTITQNAANHGGGIWMSGKKNSTLTMTGGKITNNSATGNGGGIHLGRSSSDIQVIAYLKGGIISNNTAPTGPDTYAIDGAQFLN